MDLRVSIVPAARGEKVVLRVCEAASMLRAIDQVFPDEKALEAARYAVNLGAGAIILAGGTGSGKTSSMYCLIAERLRQRPDTSVLMVEDPIEYRLPRTTQVQINPAVGLGFSQVVRSALRQDPDVIVVGETRDPETALIALEASITGHLMLTSMHANDTFAGVQRLDSLKCPRPLLAQGLSLIIAQRLVPKLCKACAREDKAPPILTDSLIAHGLVPRDRPGEVHFPGRCDACQQTGYAGRVAVTEVLRVDDDIKSMLMGEQSLNDIRDRAEQLGRYHAFERSAAQLLKRGLIGAADALLAVAR
jgi:type II secretory ATPase GspE/PulE/Tfp pilus assembly ATPase PilB-like protein